MTNFQKAVFVKSAVKPQGYPKLGVDEIAVVGRSNVGKSSLLNHLFQRKKLVKTSSTPGKTQLINFFLVDDSICFADLPGYGYAQVPVEVRKRWGPMIQSYLDMRKELKAILFLIDIRRNPNDDDKQFLAYASYRKIPLVLVLTKCDKVTRNKRELYSKKIKEGLESVMESSFINVVHFSSTKKYGRDKLIEVIDNLNG